MQCVCCLLKTENSKQLRTFTATDKRLYHELTKLQIELKNRPKICFDCKTTLKKSADFFNMCVKSYEELTVLSESVLKLETKRTRRKIISVIEQDETPELESIDDNDQDSVDELPISILKQQLQKDKSILSNDDQSISQIEQQKVLVEKIVEEKKTKSLKKNTSRFLCTDCGVSFSTSQRLQIHSYTHSGIKNWKCDDCDKVFATKFRLKSHSRIHSGERPFVCDICSFAFAQGNALKCHKRIHTKERPFVCKICSKSFSQNTTLKTHMAALHLGKTVECEEPGCNKKFTRRSYLLIHMRDHAGERKYACDRCPNQYKQKSHLDRHIEATHLGIRHKCNFSGCNSEFSKAWSLKMHKFVHASESNLPYQCQLCGFGFHRRDKLLKHKTKMHPESSDAVCTKTESAVAAVDSNLDTNFVVLTSSPEIYTIHNLDGSVTQVQTLQVVEEK